MASFQWSNSVLDLEDTNTCSLSSYTSLSRQSLAVNPGSRRQDTSVLYDPDQLDEEIDSPPPWFSNQADEPVYEEETSTRRWIIAGVAMLVILVLILIPIINAAVLQRRQDNLPEHVFDRAALQFASAILFARSEGRAMIFAEDEAGEGVDEVVAYFRDRPPYSNQARIQVGATPCPARNDAQVCYLGRLFDPRAGISPAIEFGMRERDGQPKVTFVQLDQTVAILDGFSQR